MCVHHTSIMPNQSCKTLKGTTKAAGNSTIGRRRGGGGGGSDGGGGGRGDGGGGGDGGGATGGGGGGSVLPTTVGAQGRAAIPRIIHQMYRTTELPEDWAHVPHAWKQLHADYTYMLWTDEQLRQLIADDYPWLLATYDAYPHDTQRWDASRFAILHKYGGVYADLDIQAVERIDALLEGQQLLLPHTPNVGLTNALMASVAAHPFMSEALRLLPAYAHAWCAAAAPPPLHLGEHLSDLGPRHPPLYHAAVALLLRVAAAARTPVHHELDAAGCRGSDLCIGSRVVTIRREQ